MRRVPAYTALRGSGLLIVILCSLSACKSPSALTAEAIGCTTREVRILDSEFSRSGSNTTWCARCLDHKIDKNYICVTSPSRERIECREVALGPPCQ